MKLRLNQTHYWNGVTNTKKFKHAIDWPVLIPYLRSNTTILDYGCGYGRLCNELDEHGYKNVIGMDSSEEMIKKGRCDYPKLDLRHNEEDVIPFPNQQFDVVLLFTILTCIPRNDDQKKLLKEIKRILKPNGLLYVSDLLINSDARNQERYQATTLEPFGVFGHEEGVVLRHHTDKHLKEVIFNGFKLISKKTFEVVTMNGNKSQAIQLIGKLIK